MQSHPVIGLMLYVLLHAAYLKLPSFTQRHTVATLADVGTSKVQCCKTHFKRICPWIQIEAQNELFSIDSAERLLSGSPDYIIDCIDNISTKVDLLAYCVKNGLKVFSAMGAGGKYDPTRIQISDISDTFEDPLARSVRIRLKKAGVSSGVPVVVSPPLYLKECSREIYCSTDADFAL